MGQGWEKLAERRLTAEGYRIRERNYRMRMHTRVPSGEVDLIAEDSGVLCFIEVKGRSGRGFGAPAESVTLEKQRRIARVAQEYVWRRRGLGRLWSGDGDGRRRGRSFPGGLQLDENAGFVPGRKVHRLRALRAAESSLDGRNLRETDGEAAPAARTGERVSKIFVVERAHPESNQV